MDKSLIDSIKVYLDTCIFSRLIDTRINESQIAALDKLSESSELNFVTSKKSFEEFIRTKKDSTRIALKMIYKFIEKISTPNLLHVDMGFNRIAFGRPEFIEDYLFKQLKNIFDDDDAEHVFYAMKENCDYFLTLDRTTILSPVPSNQEVLTRLCPTIKFVDPIELINKSNRNL